MKKSILNINSITFGKYKGKTLDVMLKDRDYCKWLVNEDWFQTNYEYLYNRVSEYNPITYFIPENPIQKENFIDNYTYFNLKSIDEIEKEGLISLTDIEKECYKFYLDLIQDLRLKIYLRIEDGKENIFAIKASSKWLKTFEVETGLNRDLFKEFINSYDLPNIPYIIEDIKKEGGIEYKGARSFIIAKENSTRQEKYWEEILKEKYGEDISCQYKYEKCIFDFINISKNTLYECKISLKDYNEVQHKKYIVSLTKYNIIYLISTDCIVDMNSQIIYTTNPTEYLLYICNIPLLPKMSKLDEIIQTFTITKIKDINEGLF